MLLENLCSSKECIEKLKDLIKTVQELDAKVGSARVSIEASGEPPLIKRVSREDLKALEKLLESLGIKIESSERVLEPSEDMSLDELFASFVFRKAFRTAVGSVPKELNENWKEGFCPICGLYPIAAFEVVKSETTMSRVVWTLFCLCGHTWDWNPLTCPRCKVSSYDAFSVALIGRGFLIIYTCNRCGHSMAVLREGGAFIGEETVAFPLLAGLAVNAVRTTQTRGSEAH
ncbi:MAG: hypothetical protein QXV55_03020 [Acidilobaceae archaeon]